MASRAEIEAQIAALKAVLKEKEIDPDFTPKELVRWDPSFLGTILNMKHQTPMPRAAFPYVSKCDGEYWALMFNGNPIRDCKFRNTTIDLEMEQICVLTHDGLVVNTDAVKDNGNYGIIGGLVYSTCNSFQSMTSVPIASSSEPDGSRPNPQGVQQISKSNTKWDTLIKIEQGQHAGYDIVVSCTNLGINFKRVCALTPSGHSHGNGVGTGPISCNCLKGTLPLCGPDDNILDHIYISSVVKLPFQDKEVIVNKYPLSKLYEEWKADKAAGRTQRGA
jgi:hypothetical protein